MFQQDFAWGAATASYQIEGGKTQGGRGLTVWDEFCERPGIIRDGSSGAVACDHYNRYKEDVAIMKEIGFRAYRFSLCWSRILPEGTGKVNQEGIDFYNGLIDELLANGIEPYVTLFHWDYPLALFRQGGWLNPKSSDWFAAYTKVVVDAFSDRVSHWMTLNEPQCFIGMGHGTGEHAPGLKLSNQEVLLAGHNALLAHGKAVQVIREHAKKAPQVGYAPVGVCSHPAVETPANIEAARKRMFSMENDSTWNSVWWMDPVLLGRYPEDGLRIYGDAVPAYTQADMDLISQPIDFFGTNIYNSCPIVADENGDPAFIDLGLGCPHTAIEWPITPEALYWGPRFLYERYHKPILITENGISCLDYVMSDGKVHDPMRIDFTARYLEQLRRATDDGIEVAGYFHWSLMDNFEWAQGYHERFGLVHVDYNTQKRTLKDSAYWMKSVIASNGADLSMNLR